MAVPHPRDAATVVVVRDALAPGKGIEVLLLQRAEGADHNSGAWVFPGGVLDASDRSSSELSLSLTDAQASARLGLEHGGLAYFLAAIRECFEEAGILLAVDVDGEYTSLEAATDWPTAAWRRDLHQGKTTLAALCNRYSLRLVPERLHYIAHWLTPLGRVKRFDTRFFVAIAPGLQAAMHDTTETRDHIWIAPRDAQSASNARRLMVPTRAVLHTIGQFRSCAELIEWAANAPEIPRTQPRLGLSAAGLESIPPWHPAYEELGKLDPHGRCDAWCELRPGVPVRISEYVVRFTNSDGHHTYRVGRENHSWEEVTPSSIRVIAQDRLVIAPSIACVPPDLLAVVDWVAASDGFLQPAKAT